MADNNSERSINHRSIKLNMNLNRRKKVLFICTHNSARSQMAEGVINKKHSGRYEAFSAGTNPTNVNPYAIDVMREIGIDISKNKSKGIDEFRGVDFDYVVTVCDDAKEACPTFPGGKKYIHKSFLDPSSFNVSDVKKIDIFRQVRNEIIDWIDKTFVKESKKSLQN
ncbi:MAG: arsenate reductase ArsC [Thermodesulfobacteriota bacterium]